MQRHVTTINAHTSAVSCLAFSHSGDRLATSSQKVLHNGTTPTTFSFFCGTHVATHTCVYQYRSMQIDALQGTVFRVFSCPDGQKLFEFRRGLKTYANISSLSFNARFLSHDFTSYFFFRTCDISSHNPTICTLSDLNRPLCMHPSPVLIFTV